MKTVRLTHKSKKEETMTKEAMIQDALKDELQAVQDYDRLIEMDPENEDVYREIRADELNHIGRLSTLLFTSKEDIDAVTAGIEGKE